MLVEKVFPISPTASDSLVVSQVVNELEKFFFPLVQLQGSGSGSERVELNTITKSVREYGCHHLDN